MDLLHNLGQPFVIAAQRMGAGTGLSITFTTYMLMLGTERISYLFADGQHWDAGEAWANLRAALVNTAVQIVLTGGLFLAAYWPIYDNLRLATIPFVWWGWVLAFLLNDLAYYTDHRIAHRTGFLWAIHTTHHSSPDMNLLVSNRGTAFDLGGLLSPAFFVLALAGMHPAMLLAVKFFGNLWGIFNHTRLVGRLGWLEGVLATPANHRVHHAVQPHYLDRNYGQTLIIWDRLFGSWQREEDAPVFGLVKQMNSRTVWDIHSWGLRQLWAQIRAAPHWLDKLRYLVKPPGWHHLGQHQTTADIVAAQGSGSRLTGQ